MRIFHTDHYVLPLPEGHRFPMRKYALLRARVQAVAGDLLCDPPAATDGELALAHDREYIRRIATGEVDARAMRRIGFPWSPQMVERSRRSAGATVAACRDALAVRRAGGAGCSVNLAGGTHHAFADHGEGYCVFNDAAIAARVVQRESLARRIAIVDLDVHQGNGTAAILADDDMVFTFSMHGQNNFPFRKQASDWDIELPDGAGDDEYLSSLGAALPEVFARARPELVIYLAGADPYAGDRLGRLALTKAGLARRDRMVLEACRDRSVPVALAMAGGYAQNVDDIVDIHFATVAAALELFAGRRVLDSAPSASPPPPR
jgi:acetoin utilization deacetylase AcuC-like enzyme